MSAHPLQSLKLDFRVCQSRRKCAPVIAERDVLKLQSIQMGQSALVWRCVMARVLWFAMLAGVLILSAGCRTMCERRPLCCRDNAPKPVFVPSPPPSPVIQQSGGFPIATPPPGAIVRPAPGLPPSISNSPGVKIDAQWNPGNQQQQDPRDVPPRIQLYAPEPI